MTGSARDSLNVAETTAWQSIWMENHISKLQKTLKTLIVSITYENTPGIQRQEGFGIQLMTAAGKIKHYWSILPKFWHALDLIIWQERGNW